MLELREFKEQVDFIIDHLINMKAKGMKNHELLMVTVMTTCKVSSEEFMRRDKYRKGVRARRMYIYCAHRLLGRTQRKIADDLGMHYPHVCEHFAIQKDMMKYKLRQHNPELRSDFARYNIIKNELEQAQII